MTGSDAMVCVLNERGHVLAVYPHRYLTGRVVLAAYCPNALEIEEEAGCGHTGSCGLAGGLAGEDAPPNGVTGNGAQCAWYSEGHQSRDEVARVHAAHVAEAH